MLKLFQQQELHADIGEYHIICELTVDVQHLMYIDIHLGISPWICQRERPQVLEEFVCEVDILLVCGI
jgi:hypothetical protein